MVMISQRTVESCVGLFLVFAIFALITLAFKVSGLTTFFKQNSYTVVASFEDIGQLKPRSAVKMGGVTIGEVTGISLDSNYHAKVTMDIHSKINNIPDDSSASILTAGLLGDNYIAINPMYSETFLKSGSEIQDTHSALVLEKLIGQFLFKIGSSGNENAKTNVSAPAVNNSTTSAPNQLPANPIQSGVNKE
jgi:phospholipid/cholesterol/gamma-HCH transport system substrate-binding protein